MFSHVRVVSAWSVSVGFGPPSALASAALSHTNSRSTQRASPVASSTEVAGSSPIRSDEWMCSGSGAKSIR
jgi:hypothetical protein